MGAIIGVFTIGTALTAVATLDQGSPGFVIGASLTLLATVVFAAVVVFGPRRLDEASDLIDKMP